MPQYKYTVAMSCSGCSNAVNRALSKLEGVDKIDIDLEKQLVVVDTDLPQEAVTQTIAKTGKAVTPLA
ncbi:ATX1 antioxidant protein 1 [Umbelopsis sp. WA50703]